MKYLLSKKNNENRDDVNGFMSGGGSGDNGADPTCGGSCSSLFTSEGCVQRTIIARF